MNELLYTWQKQTQQTQQKHLFTHSISVAWYILLSYDPDVINFKANFGLEIENLEVRNLVLQERPLYDRIKLKKRDAQ